ncbi:MAG: GIY-YIG nuclease family protein [Propionibacteriaceae bacterium]|nr:GIY-YIG nuclease family protein [Propionibacteriaceae bacterium]
MSDPAYVYILANRPHGTLYCGVTNDLTRRIIEHRSGTIPGFTAKYHIHTLVWFIAGESIVAAIELEKKIKNRPRVWKIALIEADNPDWRDLSLDFVNAADGR